MSKDADPALRRRMWEYARPELVTVSMLATASVLCFAFGTTTAGAVFAAYAAIMCAAMCVDCRRQYLYLRRHAGGATVVFDRPE